MPRSRERYIFNENFRKNKQMLYDLVHHNYLRINNWFLDIYNGTNKIVLFLFLILSAKPAEHNRHGRVGFPASVQILFLHRKKYIK